jgi:hypothetical protein
MQSGFVIPYSQSLSPPRWSPWLLPPGNSYQKKNRGTPFQYAVINLCMGKVWRVLDFFQFQVCRDSQRLLTPIPAVNDGEHLLHGFPFLLRLLLASAEAAGHEIA